MMSKSCKNNFRKFLSKAAIKTNILSIFPRMNQRINLVCKYDIEFCGENERKRYVTCMTVLRFVAWLGSELFLHEMKWYQICQPWEKEQKEKQRFQKFVILQLHLFENLTVVAKVISLCVEKELPLEYIFLSWKKLLTKGFLQKEMIFVRAIFLVWWKTFVEKDF